VTRGSASRAAIYTRVSLDRSGDSTSPERQRALCVQLAEARGLEVVATYTDSDKSAWKRGVKRPGWDSLMAAVRRGEVDAVMAYSLTRIGRRVGDLLELSEFLQGHAVDLIVYDQNLDTSTPGGKVMFTMIAALAQMESEQTSERVKSHHRLAAENGMMHTGGSRAFGYNKDGTLNRREAQAAREAAGRIVRGESLGQVSAGLNKRGILTTMGNLWTGQQLSQALRSPRMAGLRVYEGRVLQGKWEAAVPQGEWADTVAELDSRKNKGTGRNVAAHLLTGLVRCGRCGQNLRAAHFRQANGQMFDRYQCQPRVGLLNCGRNAASKASTDRVVTERFFEFLSRVQMRPADEDERSVAELGSAVEEAQAKLTRLAQDHYVKGVLDEGTFLAVHDELTKELEDLRRALGAVEIEAAMREGAPPAGDREAIEQWWAAASLEDRRAALRRAIDRIIIAPAKHRGGNVFDEDRVHIAWTFAVYSAGASAGVFREDRLVDEFLNEYEFEILPPG